MNSGTYKIFQSVARGDFLTSASLLLELSKEGISASIVAEFAKYEERTAPSLRFRDHVFSFLGLTPLYCAIQTSSADVLSRFTGGNDLSEIQEKSFAWSKELLDSDDPLVSHKYLDSERLLTTRYACVLPDVLERRAREIESCRIPVSPDGNRFCVIPLDDTFYGHRLLLGLGEKYLPPAKPTVFFYQKLILSKKEWQPMREALVNLGYDPEGMLLEAGESEWSTTIEDLLRNSRIPQSSKEVVCVRDLYDCVLALDLYHSEATVHRIASFESNYANRSLMSHVRSSHGNIRFEVVKALTDSGDPKILDFFSGLISDADQKSKGILARGISSLASAMSTFQKQPPTMHVRKPSPVETTSIILELKRLSRHLSVSLRIDALTALAALNDQRAHNIILNAFLSEKSVLVRSEIVSLTKHLPREVAAKILKIALEDFDHDVVSQAELTILLLGGDFLHEYSNEDEHELN